MMMRRNMVRRCLEMEGYDVITRWALVAVEFVVRPVPVVHL